MKPLKPLKHETPETPETKHLRTKKLYFTFGFQRNDKYDLSMH